MVAKQKSSAPFFRDLQKQAIDFDGERFLTEVDAQFHSPELLEEVKWRLEVLHELSQQRHLETEFEVLRDRLTQIFAMGGEEAEVAAQVKALTGIETPGGRAVELRHFLLPERRLYNERAYRDVLERKIDNTRLHLLNLHVLYPDQAAALRQLGKLMDGLDEKIRDPQVRTRTVKSIEDDIRNLPVFATYEALKERFLRDWLARFAGVAEAELARLGPEEVQRLIQEHQRHQTTQLVQAGVRPLDTDIHEHLGIHDTLEGEFRDEEFWRAANVRVKRDFNAWVLQVVQAVGMVNGHRFAFFQSEADELCYLLCGLALPRLPEPTDEGPIRMVPYLKPFTRKAGYLLEVRARAVGERPAYYAELRHYTLPFLFGFDKVPALEVPKPLRDFFNTHY